MGVFVISHVLVFREVLMAAEAGGNTSHRAPEITIHDGILHC